MSEVAVTILEGHVNCAPVIYAVVERTTGPWWWRRTEWVIETGYGAMSRKWTKDEAEAQAGLMRAL